MVETNVCAVCITSSVAIEWDLELRSFCIYVSLRPSSTQVPQLACILQYPKQWGSGRIVYIFVVEKVPALGQNNIRVSRSLLQFVLYLRCILPLRSQNRLLFTAWSAMRRHAILLQETRDIYHLVIPPKFGLDFAEPSHARPD